MREALEPYVGTSEHGRRSAGFGRHDNMRKYYETKYTVGERDAYIGVGTDENTLSNQDSGVDYLLCGRISHAFWDKRSDGTIDLPGISTQAASDPHHCLGFAMNFAFYPQDFENQDYAKPGCKEFYEPYETLDLGLRNKKKDPGLPIIIIDDPVANDFYDTARRIGYRDLRL